MALRRPWVWGTKVLYQTCIIHASIQQTLHFMSITTATGGRSVGAAC